METLGKLDAASLAASAIAAKLEHSHEGTHGTRRGHVDTAPLVTHAPMVVLKLEDSDAKVRGSVQTLEARFGPSQFTNPQFAPG